MKVAFLITNGGPHPSDRWAELTADAIVDTILVDNKPDDVSDASKAARKSKRDLRNRLFEIFDGHHSDVQRVEQADNAAVKTVAKAASRADHIETPIDPGKHVDRVMTQVKAAFAQTPWATHLAQPEVLDLAAKIIGQHTADVMHIERRWHHDRLSAAKGA